jgi:spindle assembly abnormal protein 6
MVVESNQFRELTHLSLNLQVGTDASIRQYLTIRLGQLMSENHMLQTFLHRENQRAVNAEDLFQQINTKFHNLTITSDSEIRQTRQQLTEQMEHTVRKQHYQYTGLIQEKDTMLRSLKESMEMKLQKVQEQLQFEESCTCDLRNKHKELTNINEDLRATLEKKEVAIKDTNQEVACAKLRIQQLENDKLTMEKSLQEAQGIIGTLQQSIKGKENSLQQADIYREATDKASAQTTESLNMHRIQLEEARAQLATVTNEMIKVTDLNVQLQKEKKDYKSKLKLRAKVIKRQEEVLCEKDTLLSNFETKVDKLLMERDKIRKMDLAKGRELEALKVKLAENAKASEQNKHVSASLSL